MSICPAERRDLIGQRDTALLPAEAKRHIRASMRKREHAGTTEATRSGGHQRNLAGEVEARKRLRHSSLAGDRGLTWPE
jgi:hypothetical protein